jgi:hypothetical protein
MTCALWAGLVAGECGRWSSAARARCARLLPPAFRCERTAGPSERLPGWAHVPAGLGAGARGAGGASRPACSACSSRSARLCAAPAARPAGLCSTALSLALALHRARSRQQRSRARPAGGAWQCGGTCSARGPGIGRGAAAWLSAWPPIGLTPGVPTPLPVGGRTAGAHQRSVWAVYSWWCTARPRQPPSTTEAPGWQQVGGSN